MVYGCQRDPQGIPRYALCVHGDGAVGQMQIPLAESYLTSGPVWVRLLKRRASKENAPIRASRLAEARARGKHTEQEWAALVEEFNGRCVICWGRGVLTKDHVVPLHRGGSDAIENIQPVCRSCNSRKGSTTDDWRSWRREFGARARHGRR